jgi:hypothetical protein
MEVITVAAQVSRSGGPNVAQSELWPPSRGPEIEIRPVGISRLRPPEVGWEDQSRFARF